MKKVDLVFHLIVILFSGVIDNHNSNSPGIDLEH